MQFSQSIALFLGIVSPVFASTAISDSLMKDWIDAGGKSLASAYSPIWFFARADGHSSCLPTWAFHGNTDDHSDNFSDLKFQTPSVARCAWPNTDCNCRNPGSQTNRAAEPFPVYYTVARCGDNEVRVAYNLFYQKDGFALAGETAGHAYDWERVIVVHKASPGIRQGQTWWQPDRIMMSTHKGYQTKAWNKIQNTLTTDEVNAGKARTPNGVQNNDHAKVYVSWSKHAQYDTRNTGFKDVASQAFDYAYRSDDFWFYPGADMFVRADSSTDAGKMMHKAKWGDATSDPVSVHDGLCSAK